MDGLRLLLATSSCECKVKGCCWWMWLVGFWRIPITEFILGLKSTFNALIGCHCRCGVAFDLFSNSKSMSRFVPRLQLRDTVELRDEGRTEKGLVDDKRS
jgi:hypothetical protein